MSEFLLWSNLINPCSGVKNRLVLPLIAVLLNMNHKIYAKLIIRPYETLYMFRAFVF
jgi:hypothetical protein